MSRGPVWGVEKEMDCLPRRVRQEVQGNHSRQTRVVHKISHCAVHMQVSARLWWSTFQIEQTTRSVKWGSSFRVKTILYNRNNRDELTAEQKAEVAKLRTELTKKTIRLCTEFEEKLHTSIRKCCRKFKKCVMKYKKKVCEMIEKIIENYQKCLDCRDEKIKEYRRKLLAKCLAEKKCLTEDLHNVSYNAACCPAACLV